MVFSCFRNHHVRCGSSLAWRWITVVGRCAYHRIGERSVDLILIIDWALETMKQTVVFLAMTAALFDEVIADIPPWRGPFHNNKRILSKQGCYGDLYQPKPTCPVDSAHSGRSLKDCSIREIIVHFGFRASLVCSIFLVQPAALYLTLERNIPLNYLALGW